MVRRPSVFTLAYPLPRPDALPICPFAQRVLVQSPRPADPDRAAPPLQPVIEDDARDLASPARAGAVAQHPAPPEADGGLHIVRRRGDDVPGLVDGPRAREMLAMRFAREDDGLDRKSTRLNSSH